VGQAARIKKLEKAVKPSPISIAFIINPIMGNDCRKEIFL
jgi:hypothetical protein